MIRFARICNFVTRTSGDFLSSLVGAVRTTFVGHPEHRRRVAFSIALISLSAKMAKADGVVSPDEVRAFHEIFSVPRQEARNVAKLYNLAKQDVAGFEAYAGQMSALCGSGQADCPMLEDILDGLFHIAKADGVLHEREAAFLARVAEIFSISDEHYARIYSRHTRDPANPYVILGISADMPLNEIKRHYRQLVAENHPDRLIARGVPEEFLAIANIRLAAINTAYEQIQTSRNQYERV